MSSSTVENISLEADSELRFEVETPDTKIFLEVIKYRYLISNNIDWLIGVFS